MRQLFGFSDTKKFRRSDDLLIKLLRIPVHHDRVIAKFLADTALIHCPQAPQKSTESDICVVDEPLLGSRLPVQVSRNELFDLKIIIIRIYRDMLTSISGSHMPEYSQSIRRISPSGRNRKLSHTLSIWDRTFGRFRRSRRSSSVIIWDFTSG